MARGACPTCGQRCPGCSQPGCSPWPKKPVTLPRDMVELALRKARIEYERMNEQQGTDPGPASECWAEFQALRELIEDIDFDRAAAKLAKREQKWARR